MKYTYKLIIIRTVLNCPFSQKEYTIHLQFGVYLEACPHRTTHQTSVLSFPFPRLPQLGGDSLEFTAPYLSLIPSLYVLF